MMIEWNIDPIAFSLGFFKLRYYSLLFCTGLAFAYIIVTKMYVKEGIPIERTDKLAVYVFLGVLIGARLGHCLFYDFAYYSQNLLEIILPFRISDGKFTYTGYQGLASHGAALGIIVSIILYSKKYKEPFLIILDKISIVTPLAGAFIRIGNFFNSEIIGTKSNCFFAVIFSKIDNIPRHPSQLYEAFMYILFFILLYQIYNKKVYKYGGGFYFGLSIMLIFIARFIIEFVKENQVSFEDALILNMGQILSLPFIFIGAAIVATKLYLYTSRNKRV